MPEDIQVGDFYEDCAYHPIRCTYSDDDTLEGVSLADESQPRSCDRYNCGPRKITQEQAEALAELWKAKGEKAVLLSRGWPEEAAEKFIKEWRTPVK